MVNKKKLIKIKKLTTGITVELSAEDVSLFEGGCTLGILPELSKGTEIKMIIFLILSLFIGKDLLCRK